MNAPIEIELKLAVAPADLQRLRDHPHVRAVSASAITTRTLDNRYFDTPDRLLATNAMALRLRRSGEHWMQTLKTAGDTAGATSTRHEWEMKVAGAQLELARLTRTPLARLKPLRELSASLAQRYAIVFSRESQLIAFPDGTRAEFAIDAGEIVVQHDATRATAPICELEIELLEGSARTLLHFVQELTRDIALVPCFDSKAARGDALVEGRRRMPVKMAAAAMQPDMPAARALAQALTAGLRCLIANLPGAVETNADSEFVHQSRVALRRMRSLLHAYRTLFDAKLDATLGLRSLERQLRMLAHVLGCARDWDMFCDSTLALLREPGVPSPDDAIRTALMAPVSMLARSRREAAYDALWRTMVSCEFASAMLAIENTAARLQSIDGISCSDAAVRLLDSQHRRTLAHARHLAADDAQALHRLRIDIKRLRYVFDFFAPLFDAQTAQPYALALAGLQGRLGRLNDLVTSTRLLAQLAHAASPERLWKSQIDRAINLQRPKLATHLMELRAATRVWADGARRS